MIEVLLIDSFMVILLIIVIFGVKKINDFEEK